MRAGPTLDSITATAWASGLFLASSFFAHTVALRLLLLFAAALCAATAAARHGSALSLLPPIWLAFALWAGWAALSLTWSVEPLRTLKELRNEIGYTALALWVCFVGAQARAAPRILLPALIAAAVAASGFALFEFVYGANPERTGWHGGPGDHSSALLTIMPCAVMLGWYARRSRVRVLVWALPALFFVSAFTTLNRTVWLGFGLQFLLLGLLILARQWHKLPRRAKLAATMVAAGMIVATSAVMLTVQTAREVSGSGKSVQSDTRLALWPEVFERIREQPLTGYGFGRGVLRRSLQEDLKAVDLHLWHAHNLFLEALLQLGVPGLALLLLLIAATVREGWRYARDGDEAVAACGMALIAVVGGMMVRNMTDTLLVRQNALLYWGVVAVLLAWGATGRARSGSSA